MKCSHAGAVGRVDDEHLFYLQSRGVPIAEAKRLIVMGFLQEVLEQVRLEELRHELEAAVAGEAVVSGALIDVAALDDLAPGEPRARVDVGETPVCLVNVDGEVLGGARRLHPRPGVAVGRLGGGRHASSAPATAPRSRCGPARR